MELNMKPIIMRTEDVQAILAGRKTMMRIPVKPQPKCFYDISQEEPFRSGDVLWARETWRVGAWDDAGSICVDYKADGFTRREWIRISNPNLYEELWQQSSDDARKANTPIDDEGNYYWDPGKGPTRWRSPVTMPREAARLFLRVKDVRVERVQDITEADSVKEGVYTDTPGYWDNGWSPSFNDPDSGGEPNYINGFKVEWDARNAKRGYGWDSNPLIWVIEFERIEKERRRELEQT